MLVIGKYLKAWELSYTSSGFVMMIRAIMLKALRENAWLEGSLCLLYGMCRKIFHPRWGNDIVGSWFFLFEKLKCHFKNLFNDDASLPANNADNWPNIWNRKNIYHALVFKILLTNKTSGRPDVFLWQTFYHPPMLFFPNMEEYM